MQKSKFRIFVGIGLGLFTGLSLTTGVYPFVASKLANVDSFGALVDLRPFVIPIGLMWAIGGGILGRQGGVKAGLLTLGTCGAISGILLGIATGGSAAMIFTGILCGLVYGGLGGLILGKAFVDSPITEE